MRSSLPVLFAAALLVAPAPAPAADPPVSEVVTVTGTRSSPAERRARARAFVRSTGVALGERPVARWIDAVCLKVVGLPTDTAAVVAGRISTIARDAGAPLAKGKCRPNVVIAFVADGPATVRDIASKRSESLQEVLPATRKTLLTGEAPIRWWYSTQARNVDGERGDGGQPPGVAGESDAGASGGSGFSGATSPGHGLPGNGDTEFQRVRRVSLISTDSVRALYAANVIIDVKRLKGVGIATVADYAALVALAEIRGPTDREQDETVLGAFTPPTPERRLTEWDAALLRALYRMPLDRTARLQRGALTAAVIAQAEKPQGD